MEEKSREVGIGEAEPSHSWGVQPVRVIVELLLEVPRDRAVVGGVRGRGLGGGGGARGGLGGFWERGLAPALFSLKLEFGRTEPVLEPLRVSSDNGTPLFLVPKERLQQEREVTL